MDTYRIKVNVVTALIENGYPITYENARRLGNYSYKENTVFFKKENCIVVRTPLDATPVYNTLILYDDGHTEVKLEFEF